GLPGGRLWRTSDERDVTIPRGQGHRGGGMDRRWLVGAGLRLRSARQWSGTSHLSDRLRQSCRSGDARRVGLIVGITLGLTVSVLAVIGLPSVSSAQTAPRIAPSDAPIPPGTTFVANKTSDSVTEYAPGTN